MKNAIITSSDAKFGDFLINHWLASLLQNVDLTNIEVVVLDYGFLPEQKKRLEAVGVRVVSCTRDGHVTAIRFRDMAKFLDENAFDQVLTTDGGDIIFQTDLKELFKTSPDSFRAVCEDFNIPFETLFVNHFFSKENESKIVEMIRNKKMINAGVLVGPYEKFRHLCHECDELLIDKSQFGPDQVAINYILYRNGFVSLHPKYNFIVTTTNHSFFIKKGVFFMGNHEKVAIVHNAGGNPLLRPIVNFGYGPKYNRVKIVTYTVSRIFTRLVHALWRLRPKGQS